MIDKNTETSVWPVLPLLLVCLGLVSCQPKRDEKAAGGGRGGPVPVETAKAEMRTVPLELSAIGTVEPQASVQLKPKVAGEILEVHFADGANVKAGDLLFTIDPRSYTAAFKKAEANVAIAQAQVANASEQLRRYSTLTQEGATSKEQLSQYQVTYDAAESELEARKADLDQAALASEWTSVKAPISGRAGAALVKAGNIVQANGDVLAVINQTEPIYVSFALPESSLAQVREWMAKGELVVAAKDPTTHAALGNGQLTFVDNTVDRDSGMINFKATFTNSDNALWPGQFVDVALVLTQEKDVVTVPTVAVMEGQQGSTVFIVNQGKADVRPIKVEREFGDSSVIGKGLKPGDEVVVSGQLRVTPGGKVNPKSAVKEPSVAANDAPANQ